MKPVRIILAFLTLFCISWAEEIRSLEIPLSGEGAKRSLEMSGLAWHGDHLILMPQYVDGKAPCFYYLTRQEILNWITGDHRKSLTPKRVMLSAPDFKSIIKGYQGFEALCFSGDRAYLLIEAKHDNVMAGYLVKGRLDMRAKTLRIEPGITMIKPPVNINNMAYESLLKTKNNLMVMYEANGANVNPAPQVEFFSTSLKAKRKGTAPAVEYRITDITDVDSNNRFWAINYFWPGDRKYLKPAKDSLVEKYGQGKTHKQFEQVERLLEFQLNRQGIELTDAPPIQLQLDEKEARNWEGIVRLDKRGFILVVDEYPRTILAFIPYSQ